MRQFIHCSERSGWFKFPNAAVAAVQYSSIACGCSYPTNVNHIRTHTRTLTPLLIPVLCKATFKKKELNSIVLWVIQRRRRSAAQLACMWMFLFNNVQYREKLTPRRDNNLNKLLSSLTSPQYSSQYTYAWCSYSTPNIVLHKKINLLHFFRNTTN
jgi:hypothetical protein